MASFITFFHFFISLFSLIFHWLRHYAIGDISIASHYYYWYYYALFVFRLLHMIITYLRFFFAYAMTFIIIFIDAISWYYYLIIFIFTLRFHYFHIFITLITYDTLFSIFSLMLIFIMLHFFRCCHAEDVFIFFIIWHWCFHMIISHYFFFLSLLFRHYHFHIISLMPAPISLRFSLLIFHYAFAIWVSLFSSFHFSLSLSFRFLRHFFHDDADITLRFLLCHYYLLYFAIAAIESFRQHDFYLLPYFSHYEPHTYYFELIRLLMPTLSMFDIFITPLMIIYDIIFFYEPLLYFIADIAIIFLLFILLCHIYFISSRYCFIISLLTWCRFHFFSLHTLLPISLTH